MKTFTSVLLGVAAIAAVALVMQPLQARADDDDANYARYQRYSREVGDWWFYHAGYFASSTYPHGAPLHRIRYLHSHVGRRIGPNCRCSG